MQPEWKRTSNLVLLCKSTNTAMEAIRSRQTDFYDLPDDTRKTSANSLEKFKLLEEEVTIDDSVQ
jgi:hypothetical protein